ncbi:MAG: hypothetical protein H6842_00685 [Rhodospirillaceae bacterium]|nr:hypothetical protein [Rhodospirillaceae bacterium]
MADQDDCREAAEAARCRCRDAVVRAYGEMLISGASERVALDVATRVYRYHHPGAGVRLAVDVVETWVYTGPLN